MIVPPEPLTIFSGTIAKPSRWFARRSSSLKTSTIFEVSTFGISEAITSKIRNPSPDSSSVVANTSISEATQGFQFQRSVNRNSTVRNTTYIVIAPRNDPTKNWSCVKITSPIVIRMPI